MNSNICLLSFFFIIFQIVAATQSSSTKKSTDMELLTPAANEYIKLLSSAVTGLLYDEHGVCDTTTRYECSQTAPFDLAKRTIGTDWPVVGHTMVGLRRIENIRDAIFHVVKNNVPGNFVELGVWRGGACIFARGVFNVLQQQHREVHLLDAFANMNEYGSESRVKYLSTSEQTVTHNFEKYGLLQNVFFHKGLFHDVLPGLTGTLKSICIMRVDGNFYSSYEDAFYYLYEAVPIGGAVIFDDIFSHAEVKKFWHDFSTDYKLSEKLIQIDLHSAWFVKTKNVTIDFNLKRSKPPASKKAGPLQGQELQPKKLREHPRPRTALD